MKNLEIFNIESLYHYTENDHDLASQMIQMALVDIPAFFDRANEKLIEQNKEEARRLLHKIKGIAGVIGAERIHSLSQDCEFSLNNRAGDEEINQKIYLLKYEIDQFCRYDKVSKTAGCA